MSWLNFNDSLNSLKGQITNFANTVLTEDVLESRSEDGLKESETKCGSEAHGSDYNTEDSWSWSAVESKTDQLKTDETITNLKKRIEELQNENRDLVASLDQLDQNYQQNTEELVKMKTKLGEELEIVTEKYEILNMKYNKLALAENGYKKKIIELKNKCEELAQQKREKKYDLLEHENLDLKEKIGILEARNTNSENSKDGESKLASTVSSIEELQMENKALKIALQTTINSKTTQENKSTLEEYENEIKHLKSELENLQHVQEKVEVCDTNEMHVLKEEPPYESKCKIISREIVQSTDQNKRLTDEYEQKITQLKSELDTLKTEKQMEKTQYVEQLNANNKKIGELNCELNEANEKISEIEKKYSDLQQIEQDLEKSNIENENTLKHQEEQISDLKDEISKKLEKEIRGNENTTEIFKQIFTIIKEHFEEYLNKDEPLHDHCDDTNSLFEIFSNRIKIIHGVLDNFKLNTDNLESKLKELDQNKIDLESEKDKEIERLLNDSEYFAQELSRKTKEIKDIEEECSELMKNNELLISKLTELKETGLQTIFESNEDNVASMEKQLDDDLKRIEELEVLLAQKDLENKRINDKIIEEVKGADSDATVILRTVEEEKEHLLAAIEELKDKLRVTETERDNCRAVIDKMKLDLETTEYQFSEMNINLETLSEEIEKHKVRIDLLVLENENLKTLRQEDSKNDEELKLTKEELIQTIYCNEILQKKVTAIEEQRGVEDLEKEEEYARLRKEIDKVSIEKSDLEQAVDLYKRKNDKLEELYHSLCDGLLLNQDCPGGDAVEISKIIEHVNGMKEQIGNLLEENSKLNSEVETFKKQIESSVSNEAQTELESLKASRNELIALVQTKHQETITYHNEIQRLSEILKRETEKNIKMESEIETLTNNSCPVDSLKVKEEEVEKLNERIDFLKQKCDVLAQSLLEEQQRTENEKLVSSEKEANLSKKLERLQSHLMEVEEHYTQELLQSEQKIALLQARLNEVERREKDSSTIYTSVSIRANQQNEALTQQLQSMTSQRDEFCKKLLDLEDENNVKSAALSNLQLVLEQFQRDKEADVIRETERIRRQVKHEQTIQEDLRKEITNLENQMKESKQGLQAALRLTDQLEMSKNQISTLREEVSVLSDKLQHKEAELQEVTSQTDGKVDKSLVKNLIIGFVTSNKNLNKDQIQILKIIATVLDFNEQDHNKVQLNQAQQNTWLHSLLTPMAGDDLPPSQSLARAFVNFLENESKPRVIPSLVHQNSPSESSSSVNSTRTTPTPIVLNEIVLPTFSDFPQHRNSSSILKGVLKDNS